MPSSTVQIASSRGPINAILHPAVNASHALILVAGAGGGVSGPMHCYSTLAKRLQEQGITAIRMDYRLPNRLGDCVFDVEQTMEWLRTECSIRSGALLGWSFGGAVVFQELAKNPSIMGGITIASQTSGATEPARSIPEHKSVLLFHGTGDSCLSYGCSKQLYALASVPENQKDLVLFSGEGHGIEKSYPQMVDRITQWCVDLFSSLKE